MHRSAKDGTDDEDGLDDHKGITKSFAGWNIADWSASDLQYFLCFNLTDSSSEGHDD